MSLTSWAKAEVSRQLRSGAAGEAMGRVLMARAVLSVLRGVAGSIAKKRALVFPAPDVDVPDVSPPEEFGPYLPEDLGRIREFLMNFEARRSPVEDPMVLGGRDGSWVLPKSRLAHLTPVEKEALSERGRPIEIVREIAGGEWYLHPVRGMRKSQGAFYTDNPLADATVKHSLELLGKAEKPRVLDPAMGCGAFLLAAMRHLKPHVSASVIARELLVGVDLDPLAVEAARLSIWLEAGDPELRPDELLANLRVGDGLFDHDLDRDHFDMVVGNPPWEILKPNSREFFSSRDPFYRRLGRKEALARQGELFALDPELKHRWEEHVEQLRGYSRRIRGEGHYALQGRGDLNTYKLFLERALRLLEDGGVLGMIVPSGIATDLGAADLRRHLLEHTDWRWLFMFENRDGIFDIHKSYRFGPVVLKKGGSTPVTRTAFMRRDPADWERPEGIFCSYPREAVHRFSRQSSAFLELRDDEERELFERLFSGCELVGDRAAAGLRYHREFDLTNHAKLFRSPGDLLSAGLKRDRFGRFVSREGVVQALPLYQGVMVRPFDCAAVTYRGERGSRADWEEQDFSTRNVLTRFAVPLDDVHRVAPGSFVPRLGFRDVQNASNERTLLAALVPPFPCGNTVPVLSTGDPLEDLVLLPILSSFVVDRVLRLKMSQNHVNWFHVKELPVPVDLSAAAKSALLIPSASLSMAGPWFDRQWLRFRETHETLGKLEGPRPAMCSVERLRLRCILDAVVAHLYGLEPTQLALILRDCHRSHSWLKSAANRRTLDPRGFWRVDRGRDPELRHTILTLVAARDLSTRLGGEQDTAQVLMDFAGVRGGGWQLPEFLDLECLEDLGVRGFSSEDLGKRRVRERLVEAEMGENTSGPVDLNWQEIESRANEFDLSPSFSGSGA